MNIGKQVRLNRLFSHPSGRLCSVAVDHFIGYQQGLPAGIADLPQVLREVVAGRPDAITMHKGAVLTCWGPHAGRVPLIVQAVSFTVSDSVIEVLTDPAEVVRLGGDAIAVAIGVRGVNEGRFLKILADHVRLAAQFDLPVIAHIYPRDFSGEPKVVHDPENIAWAVRCGLECGADVIKTPFTGDAKSFRQIVASCPVPVVAAGGPKCDSLADSLRLQEAVVASGARGATIGRNVWGFKQVTAALLAFKAVIHDGKSAAAALKQAGLSGRQ